LGGVKIGGGGDGGEAGSEGGGGGGGGGEKVEGGAKGRGGHCCNPLFSVRQTKMRRGESGQTSIERKTGRTYEE